MQRQSSGGLSAQTLSIAAVASAAASFAASRLWGPGTLVSAAATPVIVALVSEVLRRPVQTVAVSARKVPALQRLPASQWQHAARARPRHAGATRLIEAERPATRPMHERQPDAGHRDAPRGARTGGNGRIRVYRSRRRWRAAILTGLAAFAIVIAFYTVSDALAGQSITGNGEQTTFFGGSAHSSNRSAPRTTTAPTSPSTQTAPAMPPTTTTSTTSPTAPTMTPPTTPSSTSSQPNSTPPTLATPAPNPTPGGASSQGSTSSSSPGH